MAIFECVAVTFFSLSFSFEVAVKLIARWSLSSLFIGRWQTESSVSLAASAKSITTEAKTESA